MTTEGCRTSGWSGYSTASSEIKQLFAQLGIAYGRVVSAVPDFALPADPMEWHPTCHHNTSDLMELAEYFVNFKKRQYLKLMYVWGHSYEFDQADNWEVIERFCEYAGGSFVKLGGPCR